MWKTSCRASGDKCSSDDDENSSSVSSDDNGGMPQLAYWTEAGVVDAVLHLLDRAHTHLDKGSESSQDANARFGTLDRMSGELCV